jgi:hypothetical protein
MRAQGSELMLGQPPDTPGQRVIRVGKGLGVGFCSRSTLPVSFFRRLALAMRLSPLLDFLLSISAEVYARVLRAVKGIFAHLSGLFVRPAMAVADRSLLWRLTGKSVKVPGSG